MFMDYPDSPRPWKKIICEKTKKNVINLSSKQHYSYNLQIYNFVLNDSHINKLRS